MKNSLSLVPTKLQQGQISKDVDNWPMFDVFFKASAVKLERFLYDNRPSYL